MPPVRKGRAPAAVWIEGKRFQSADEAAKALGCSPATVYSALRYETKVRGLSVSRAAPGGGIEEPPAKVETRRTMRLRGGGPLMFGERCTHRLGVYREQGV